MVLCDGQKSHKRGLHSALSYLTCLENNERILELLHNHSMLLYCYIRFQSTINPLVLPVTIDNRSVETRSHV